MGFGTLIILIKKRLRNIDCITINNAVVKKMEHYRDNTAAKLAGYTSEIKKKAYTKTIYVIASLYIEELRYK
ncbi:hypothetical protein AGMMS49921_12170 [Endomicrobiia bacterium]|nr:hypothetical protein AGMMS49921_12170 [Endomicrobiia bacterium]